MQYIVITVFPSHKRASILREKPVTICLVTGLCSWLQSKLACRRRDVLACLKAKELSDSKVLLLSWRLVASLTQRLPHMALMLGVPVWSFWG